MIAFLPLFTMQGVEGAIFSPMSHTYAYALGIAIVLAVTLSPVLCSFLLRKGHEGDAQFHLGGLSPLLSQPVRADSALAALTLLVIIAIVIAGVLSMFPLSGRRVPAQARRRQYLGACDNAADYLARLMAPS